MVEAGVTNIALETAIGYILYLHYAEVFSKLTFIFMFMSSG